MHTLLPCLAAMLADDGVTAAALVILLPLFVMADPGEGAVRIIIIMQNVVLGGFLAMLFWIFRWFLHRAPAHCSPASLLMAVTLPSEQAAVSRGIC